MVIWECDDAAYPRQPEDEETHSSRNNKVNRLYEPRSEKTGFLHMRKQRRRSASR